MSRIGKQPIPLPERREGQRPRGPRGGPGPQGQDHHARPARDHLRGGGRHPRGHAAGGHQAGPRLPRPHPRTPRQRRQGRERGLQEGAGHRGRRLQGRPRRQEAQPEPRLLAPGGVPHPRGHHDHRGEEHPPDRRRGTTGSRSARWPPRSGRTASASPTRARACSTRTRPSSARPARPRSKGDRRWPSTFIWIANRRGTGGRSASASASSGTATAPRLCVFKSTQLHLCPGGGRHQGRHHRRGVLAGARGQGVAQDLRQARHGGREGRRARVRTPQGEGHRAAWSSTAAATSTTAV